MPRLHCIVRGRVQGVGFRYFAQAEATRRNLRGWVRNLWGGSVETEVEGPREALEAYLAQMRSGPALSRVLEVDVQWFDDDDLYNDFEVRPTDFSPYA